MQLTLWIFKTMKKIDIKADFKFGLYFYTRLFERQTISSLLYGVLLFIKI